MPASKRSPVTRHRARKARAGFVRMEVSVRREDAPLLRRVAAALSDPERQSTARALLVQRFTEPATVSLKALLVAAPLGDIDLDRSGDRGRDIDL